MGNGSCGGGGNCTLASGEAFFGAEATFDCEGAEENGGGAKIGCEINTVEALLDAIGPVLLFEEVAGLPL